MKLLKHLINLEPWSFMVKLHGVAGAQQQRLG